MANFNTDNFSAYLTYNKGVARIKQQVNCAIVNTAQLPATYALLVDELPSIFDNECFNPGNIPFSEEVKQTEVGHLFEHVVLEYLKLEAEDKNYPTDIQGTTDWNWDNEPFGCFNIEIEIQDAKLDIKSAFIKAGKFLEKLYKESTN